VLYMVESYCGAQPICSRTFSAEDVIRTGFFQLGLTTTLISQSQRFNRSLEPCA
jgi:hypothetical protein